MILRVFRWTMFCLLMTFGVAAARGELVLANFSTAHPMKIMAIGDSITDDCEVNGAWRQYLQPLLQTNGYPFTFVGRNSSTPTATFTQVHHEGYCGAVIAPPGVLSYSVYGYAGSNVDLETIVPDALAANTPDLILLLIGANDIGRGRDPIYVATNDMPALLNIIFSNAPNTQVILAKITSLQSAMTGGLDYGTYATNVYIYNAALQAMVNQRRALGQNVSLADMFSVVNPSTMFMSDHLHPNTNGLQAIAQEWMTRIQAITITTNQATSILIHGGDTWNYNDTGENLGTNWVVNNYDDSAWSNGPARLGYGDETIATTVSYGSNPSNRYITTYFRHPFVPPENVAFTNLQFRLALVDGGVVWFNGQQAFVTNMPAGPITYTNLAVRSVSLDPAYTFYQTTVPAADLLPGTNEVAVEVHLKIATRITMGMDMELIGSGEYIPAPTLGISFVGGNAYLSWPESNGAGYALYSTTNLAAPGSWTNLSTPLQTNAGQISATFAPDAATRFFRLQQ